MVNSTTMSFTTQRLKQVYVEIPPSPLHLSARMSENTHVASPSLARSNSNHTLKENTLFRHSPHATHALSHKRRLSDISAPAQPSKKSKTDTPEGAEAQPTPELLTCHNCGKKREPSAIVQCNYPDHTTKKAGKRSCIAKYCGVCLKKRYQEDIEQIKKRTSGDTYKCPKCRELCNCWKCRNRKGLVPLKNITQDSNTSKDAVGSSSNKAPSGDSAQNGASLHGGSVQPQAAPKPRVKPLPRIDWAKHPIAIPLDEFETRVQIREFVTRFAPVMGTNIAKSHLEELEYLTRGPVPDEEGSGRHLLPWVSEGCLKSVVLGLLGLLADEEDSSAARVMKTAMKEIRSSGNNLNKIFAVLADLRDKLGHPDEKSASSDGSGSSEDRIIIEFPDPLPPPPSSSTLRTRTATSPVQILESAQLIPVVIGLIETATESYTVRNEIEEGVQEGKEKVRETRETIKNENDKFESLKKHLEELSQPEDEKQLADKLKNERSSHKSTVQAIESALKVVMPFYAPRFGPLGTDHDGRTYWALSPNVRDRTQAFQFLSLKSSGSLPKKNRTKKDTRKKENADAEGWTRFLVVWGKRPWGDNMSGEKDEGEAWWIFWEPAEIQKLSEWISMVNGSSSTATKESSSTSSTKSSHSGRFDGLTKNLKDFAISLEWRIKGDE
ncbi:hypothetical protein D9758_001868 [Tetrapyrgos nigripes]|uniref:Zinc-finger domain-containing protein n=1 Tax=Tetrapyrgos nigripes TaxID=182062 RepID=A0A8H5GTV0_9AGAR|nr:hypothetical protein D9758_001868 [Tetrapyrgos nigripes]